jgi:hypothetical protein
MAAAPAASAKDRRIVVREGAAGGVLKVIKRVIGCFNARVTKTFDS